MKPAIRRLLLLLLLIIPLMVSAQDNKPNKAQKKADKKKEQRIENEKKSEIKGRKRHQAIQSKEVRKRMKQHNRYVNRAQSHKKRGFLYRLFHRNEH